MWHDTRFGASDNLLKGGRYDQNKWNLGRGRSDYYILEKKGGIRLTTRDGEEVFM